MLVAVWAVAILCSIASKVLFKKAWSLYVAWCFFVALTYTFFALVPIS